MKKMLNLTGNHFVNTFRPDTFCNRTNTHTHTHTHTHTNTHKGIGEGVYSRMKIHVMRPMKKYDRKAQTS
jgi:hypothetical protein